MMQKKSGLNDSDKILVTVALWIAAISLFTASLSLPMLPDKVTIFYRPTEDGTAGEFYSKYNNLFIILVSIIPAVVVLISAILKKRNRLQNSFISIVLFSIMLSLSMGSVIIYGIMQQFNASSSVQRINFHALSTLIVAFILSVFSSVVPSGLHASAEIEAQKQPSELNKRLMCNLDAHWNIGAYGYLIVAIACSFVPAEFCYIPLAAAFALHIVFLLTFGIKRNRQEA